MRTTGALLIVLGLVVLAACETDEPSGAPTVVDEGSENDVDESGEPEVDTGVSSSEDSGVVPLMRAGEHRPDLDFDELRDDPNGRLPSVLEIADTPELADDAWADNTPDGLDELSELDEPVEEGIYGSLDDVDFESQVAGVWSSTHPSCPYWLKEFETTEDGIRAVEESTAEPEEVCSDIAIAYRMIVAIDRDELPPLDELPAEHPRDQEESPFPPQVITTYPATP